MKNQVTNVNPSQKSFWEIKNNPKNLRFKINMSRFGPPFQNALDSNSFSCEVEWPIRRAGWGTDTIIHNGLAGRRGGQLNYEN